MSDDARELREHLDRLQAAGTSPRGLVTDDDLKDIEALTERHMERFHRPDGKCLYCRQPADRFHPIGPIVIQISEPDTRDEPFTHEFCVWGCFSHWAAVQSGGRFVAEHQNGERPMMQEIPDAVLDAIKDVVEWRRGGDEPGDVGVDDILADAIPTLDEWLVSRGLLPAED